ncbi:hypothetical protein [Streptomyces sp. NBRC 110028]|uniref:hypothetical protein n=1 Tax=Streptomyces sp. NBRC 110028 TaxID=1621260 RepID=UPI0006E3B546|nr:hypothetical protein [Streptomyces sp. NBRC 110028]
MGSGLYNLGRVMDTLAPALLGMPPGGGPWGKRTFPAGEPVVEVVGGRATGKTALLDALYDGYHAWVPTARVDLGEAPYSAGDPGDRARLDTASASPVTNLLFTVSHQLGYERDGSRHTLTFPRLAPALLVISAWRPESRGRDAPHRDDVAPADLVAAEEELGDILAQRDPDPQARKVVVGRWLNALGGVVAGLLPGVPGLQEVLSAATDTLLARSDDGRDGSSWWRSHLDRIDGDAVQRLFALVRKFRRGGAARAEVEADLIAALLADINGAYGPWKRRTQHPPLILLDNVDEALRERFLGPFVDRYARDSGEWRGRGRIMLPVVFATSLGDGSAQPSLTTDVPPWTKPERCPPHVWLLRLGIPKVDDAEIRSMLGDDAAYPPSLPDVIARLSGGRTGDALLLAGAATARLDEPGPFALDRLLSLAVPGSAEPVGARLLERLLPEGDVREEVLRIAPALDAEAAARLLRADRAALPGISPELRVRRLRDATLERPHWDHRPWPTRHPERTPLITDRALRALLLHRLRTGADEARWTGLHALSAACYNDGDVRSDDSDRHDRRYLHHALAQGRIDTLVARAMHYRYLHRAPAEWLGDLNLIAAAPPARTGFAPGEPPDDAPGCASCESDADQRVHAAIRLLLATVWRLSAPLSAVPPSYRDADLVHVRTALEALCSDYGNSPRRERAYNAYVDAIADGGWIDALVSGVQAPDLPVKGSSR